LSGLYATSFSVDSGRCDHKTEITAESKGMKISICMTTTCPNVKAYSEILKEVDLKKLTNPVLSNPIYIAASGKLGPECVVPCAVVSTTWTEAGMVSKTLLKKYKTVSFTYEDADSAQG